ncbi:52 kDa repressor of the inhibitor of the protein kinase-like [Acyrthosiphon pisum]|uniref:Uncharacterized protein n=1 Tax=Acyrthosiphon pisum TaxID=7029 RepID=A0A8R1WXU8_ACYPI|nr:52 kDa repressor of the inhibitor of the protein kinase-like [Acyrthosiphon pisum]|eukprot:XP_008178700.1 PREDICTED: 52 kDa repressor of the inhibitor of the protein kinase-like [Acyrthosiphon pisum]
MHLTEASSNATYLSGKMQNEIINSCGTLIQRQIVSKINKSQCFTILADETADVSGTEQFSICIRYFDTDLSKIMEDFLIFVPVTDVTGNGLATVILNTLTSLGLNLNYLRGQGYDGAAAMSGCFNGVQAHITEKYPLALYLHCTSHCLNLAVSYACNVKSVRNTIGSIQEIAVFFRTPKRQHVLEKNIEKISPSLNIKRLKMMCPTRWVERHDSILVFLELFDSILEALEEISQWVDLDTSSTAKRLLIAMQEPEFVITTHIVAKVFSINMPLSRQLKTENIDLVLALQLANDVRTVFQDLRRDSSEGFSNEFKKIEEWSKTKNLDIDFYKLTRIQKRSINGNITAEDYYRSNVYIPFLENFLTQLEGRCLQHRELLQCFRCLLPGYIIYSDTDNDFKLLIKTYKDDLDCSEMQIMGEMYLWQNKCKSMSTSTNIVQLFCECENTIFPCIYKLLKILITLPVTTATSERSFSTLKRLKTYLRNTTGQSRLNGLALMNIHRDIPLSIDQIIDEFSLKARRMNFRLD